MPFLTVCVVVIHEGRVLLTKRDDFRIWCLPSGGVDDRETVAEAAIRETREESGLEVELTRLVGVYSRPTDVPSGHAVVFAARPAGGAIRTQPGENVDVAYFEFGHLPDALAFGHHRRIQDAVQGVHGSVVLQRPGEAVERTVGRAELYALRDQSDLSPEAFYMTWFKPNQIHEERQL